MKILILSNSEWNDENSFGSSFSNIFGDIDGLEIANIYCRSGLPNTKVAKKFFQITENTLLKNLINSSNPSGLSVVNSTNGEFSNTDEFSKKQLNLITFIRNNRWLIFFWLKGIIWMIGRWRSKDLKSFIDEFNPDIIFLPIYYSVYLNRIGLFLKSYSKKPMYGYISDDNYTLRQFSLSPFFWIDRFVKRRWVKKAVDACNELFVISSVQKEDYDKAFDKDCKILFKGGAFSENLKLDFKINNPVSLVYTGNIGDGRYKSLSDIGTALENIYNRLGIEAVLNIYTQTPLNKSMQRHILHKRNIKFHGSVSRDKVYNIQANADILVHVESLDIKERLKVRHSFSTKIVDYFEHSKCIFAVGWQEAASIKYLIDHKAALVANSSQEIEIKLEEVLANKALITQYGEKAFNLGVKNHQIKDIQSKLISVLVGGIQSF